MTNILTKKRDSHIIAKTGDNQATLIQTSLKSHSAVEIGFRGNLRQKWSHITVRQVNAFEAGLIALGAALNVTIGYLVNLLKLPIYLDSIGTVFIAVLCGWKHGAVVGIAALIVLAFTAIPTVLAYGATAIAIAMTSSFMVRFGFLKNLKATIVGGLIIGLVSAITATPVTTFVFGGVSLAGADAITALLRTFGLPLWQSVILGKLIVEPIDKVATALICYSLVHSLPPRMISRLEHR